MILGTWLLLTLVLASGSFLTGDMPNLALTHDNLMWVALAAFTMLIGEIFSRQTADPYGVIEPDKTVLMTTRGLASIMIGGALVSTLAYSKENGFDGEAAVWSFVTIAASAYLINKFLRIGLNALYLLNVKLQDYRASQQIAVQEEWLMLETAKFDEWERQHEAGTLPSSFEDLR